MKFSFVRQESSGHGRVVSELEFGAGRVDSIDHPDLAAIVHLGGGGRGRKISLKNLRGRFPHMANSPFRTDSAELNAFIREWAAWAIMCYVKWSASVARNGINLPGYWWREEKKWLAPK